MQGMFKFLNEARDNCGVPGNGEVKIDPMNPQFSVETFNSMLHELTDHLLQLAEEEDEEQLVDKSGHFEAVVPPGDMRYKDFILGQVFPSMAGRPESETLMRGLKLEDFFMMRPGGPLERDMVAIFTYSQEQDAYVNVAYSKDLNAY